MTNFIIDNMQITNEERNTLATFNLVMRDLGLTLRNITLSRPVHVTAPETWLFYPDARRERVAAFVMSAGEFRGKVGAAACAVYTAMTGEPASFNPPALPEPADGEVS